MRRFVEWRRESDAWSYGVITAAWCGATWSVGAMLEVANWAALWVGSASIWLLVMEVGLAYLARTLYLGHRLFEAEGAAEDEPKPAADSESKPANTP